MASLFVRDEKENVPVLCQLGPKLLTHLQPRCSQLQSHGNTRLSGFRGRRITFLCLACLGVSAALPFCWGLSLGSDRFCCLQVAPMTSVG